MRGELLGGSQAAETSGRFEYKTEEFFGMVFEQLLQVRFNDGKLFVSAAACHSWLIKHLEVV